MLFGASVNLLFFSSFSPGKKTIVIKLCVCPCLLIALELIKTKLDKAVMFSNIVQSLYVGEKSVWVHRRNFVNSPSVWRENREVKFSVRRQHSPMRAFSG